MAEDKYQTLAYLVKERLGRLHHRARLRAPPDARDEQGRQAEAERVDEDSDGRRCGANQQTGYARSHNGRGLVDALSFGLSALLISRIGWRSEARAVVQSAESFLHQIREGLVFILRHRILRALAASISLLRFFSSMFVAVELVYFVRILHLSPTTIGLVFAAMGLGGVAGALAASWLNRSFGVGWTITIGFAPVGSLLIPLAPVSAPIPWLIAGGFLGAFSVVASNVSQLGLRQSMTPRRLQGRMTASMRFLIMAPAPVGALLGGVLGTLVGLRFTLWVSGLGGILAAVPLVLSGMPGIRAIAPSAIDEDDATVITSP